MIYRGISFIQNAWDLRLPHSMRFIRLQMILFQLFRVIMCYVTIQVTVLHKNKLTIHQYKVTDASTHHEKMKDFMTSKIRMLFIKYGKL